jgi:hypothetical protein
LVSLEPAQLLPHAFGEGLLQLRFLVLVCFPQLVLYAGSL